MCIEHNILPETTLVCGDPDPGVTDTCLVFGDRFDRRFLLYDCIVQSIAQREDFHLYVAQHLSLQFCRERTSATKESRRLEFDSGHRSCDAVIR